MDDGDAQLPAPAQQPEGDLCLVSGADKASLTQKVSLFLSYVTVGVLIFYHSLFSSPHHHLQSLQPESPQRHHLSTLSQLLSLLQSIFPSTRKLLFSKSQYQNILVDTDEFITNFPLAIENSEKGVFQACNDLVICASHYCCKSGISRILQVLNACIL